MKFHAGDFLLDNAPWSDRKVEFDSNQIETLIEKNQYSDMPLCHANTREDSTYGNHQMVNTEIWLIIFFTAKDGEALYSQQKQDQELTVAEIMNSLLPNSDLNGRK